MKHIRLTSADTFLRLLLIAAILCTVALSSLPPQNASADETGASSATSGESAERVVRVGYVDNPGSFTQNEDGTYSGYTYDYLMQIAQYTGWTYEFVEAPGETENDRAMSLVEMLTNAEVDIEGSMAYSAALAQTFEYPKNSYGTVRTVLFAPNGTQNLTQTNIFTHDELRVAIYKTAKMRRAELEYFCTSNNLQLQIVECESMEEMQALTLSGEVDAFLDVDLNVREGFHIATAFSARPYFFAAPHGQREIIDEVDRSIERINESNPALQTSLYNKYFLKPDEDLTLTDEELAFARNHEPIRVGILSEMAPIQAFDAKTGELKGATRGILDYLTQHTGLTFEIVSIKRADDIKQTILDADVDLVAGIDTSFETASSLGLSLTAPYLTSSSLIVYNKHTNPDALDQACLALPWELSSLVGLSDKVLICDTYEQCFQAVDSGQADYTYANSYTAPYYMNQSGTTNLLTLPKASRTVETTFGVVRPVEPDLLLIINKSIRALSAPELDSIVYDNSLIDKEEQAGQFIRDHLVELAIAAIAILLLVVVLLGLYLRTRTKVAQTMREENRRFQKIYSLANEQFFEYLIKSDRLIVSLPGGSNNNFSPLDTDEMPEEGQAYRTIENAREHILTTGGEELMRALTEPENKMNDLRYQTPDRTSSHWIRVTAHFVNDDAGNPVSVIGKVTNIDDEMREKLDLSQRALHDGLTGLLNWEAFQTQAAQLLRTGSAGALLIIDVDDFKLVNDTYGHMIGDKALRHSADALRRAFRPNDLVGRLGGDEFAVCLDGHVSHELLEERCRKLVERGVTFISTDGKERTLTLSVGGVELHGSSPAYDSVYQLADRALYRAKAEGKDRFVITPYTESENGESTGSEAE